MILGFGCDERYSLIVLSIALGQLTHFRLIEEFPAYLFS